MTAERCITADDLIELIERSEDEMEICAPDDDFYAAPNAYRRSSISYLNPQKMRDGIRELFND